MNNMQIAIHERPKNTRIEGREAELSVIYTRRSRLTDGGTSRHIVLLDTERHIPLEA